VTDKQVTDRPNLPSLTGLRFFAAFTVVLDHFASKFPLFDPTKATSLFERAWCKILFDSGAEAVSLFYVLSGFVLVYTYLRETDVKGSRWDFYVARFARIYPAYLVGFAIGAVPYFLWPYTQSIASPWAMATVTLLLLQTWTLNDFQQWNPPGWSVSVEAFFYAVFPFLLGPVARVSSKGLLVLAVVFYLATYSGGFVTMLSPGLFDTAVNPIFRLPEFVIGMCAGMLFLRQTLHPVIARIPTFAIVLILWCAMTAVAGVGYGWRHNGLLSPIFALLIYRLAIDEGHTARLLSSSVIVVLGEASYALYIVHWPILQYLTHLLPLDTAAITFAPYVITAVATSVIVFFLIEKPARRWLRGTLKLERISRHVELVVGAPLRFLHKDRLRCNDRNIGEGHRPL